MGWWAFDIDEVSLDITPPVSEKQVKEIIQQYLPQIKEKSSNFTSISSEDLQQPRWSYLLPYVDRLQEGWYITNDGNKIMYIGGTKYNDVRYEQLPILTRLITNHNSVVNGEVRVSIENGEEFFMFKIINNRCYQSSASFADLRKIIQDMCEADVK